MWGTFPPRKRFVLASFGGVSHSQALGDMSGSNPQPSAFPIIDTTNFPKMANKTTVTVKRWICDVCQVASFDDYDEACRHEEECAKQQLRVEAIQKGQQDKKNEKLWNQQRPKRGNVPMLHPTRFLLLEPQLNVTSRTMMIVQPMRLSPTA